MAEATVVRFIDGPLGGQVMEIKGNPRTLDLPVRLSPLNGSIRIGTISYKRAEHDRQTYEFVEETQTSRASSEQAAC